MANYKKAEELYEGKAKKIFAVEREPELLWQVFKDSFTAFNGEKKATMPGKGKLNCAISSVLYRELENKGVKTHFMAQMSEVEIVTRKLEMIPLEVVVRNRLAGSTAKKFQIEEGSPLPTPLTEFYFKRDELGDPFISDEQAMMLGAVRKREDLTQLKMLALTVNQCLLSIFNEAGIDLIDFKLEFGYGVEGDIVLGDEISPDSCRLWDQKTKNKMDKDRFRRDLGDVLENYHEVLDRLLKVLGGQ